MNLEVSFALNQNKVIPIDVDAIRERVTSAALRELPWVNEEQDSRSGPSAGVLESISNFFKFSKRNTITRRIVGAMASVFFLVAAIAVWQWRVAVRQRALSCQGKSPVRLYPFNC